MGAGLPKQYLLLAGKTVLQRSIEKFTTHPTITGVVVALAHGDERFGELACANAEKVVTVTGGVERCDSVLSMLEHLRTCARDDDWVLVHDAARPCVREHDIDRLIALGSQHPVGGLLAVPVRDTMKRADAKQEVSATIERAHLWHAQTPQMFRIGSLNNAIQSALAAGSSITDEASAMELSDLQPLLIPGHADNIKITEPEDCALAESLLLNQTQELGACE